MLLERNNLVVMTGDSITDCGRARPLGDSRLDTLGDGYVSIIDHLLTATRPDLQVHILNTGVSGDTVRDLAARWERDVVALRPDVVSVMIGINDVWRQFDTDPAILKPVRLDEYSETLSRLVGGIMPKVRVAVVMLPFYLRSAPGDLMAAMREDYAAAARSVADTHGAIVVDTQAAFEAVLPYRSREQLAPDGVHPTALGHTLLARAWLRAVGFEW